MAHTRYTGRVQGQGTDTHWLAEAGKQRRYDFAHAVAKSAINRAGKCPKCSGVSVCRDSRVTPGNGAKSWWVCQVCGHTATREISPEKMAEYYSGKKLSPAAKCVQGVTA